LHKIKKIYIYILIVSYASQTWPLTPSEGSVLTFTVDRIATLPFS